MTPTRNDRLDALLAAYGTDPARWPAADRALADAFASDPGATYADAQHDARDLDEALDALRATPAPETDLRRTILLAVAREPRRPHGLLPALRELWQELGGTRIAAPALAAALAFGVGMAWMTASLPADDGDDAEDVLALAQFEQSYEETSP